MHNDANGNINFVVLEEWDQTRLDVFVFNVCDHLPSRTYAAKLIQKGAVRVNGKLRKASFLLRQDDIVDVDPSFLQDQHTQPKAEVIELDIIYEDDEILVLNKPAGLVVHPGAGVSSGTLVNALLAHCGGMIPSLGEPERAGIVHRLDRDTSGVMVTAKTQFALSVLSQQFATHEHTRVYHAICYGKFERKEGRIETGYGRDPRNRLKYKTFPIGEGKRAVLNYKVLKEFCDCAFSLVECTLETGRTHQIRVQMASLKHPVVGDVLYSYIPASIQNNKTLFDFVKNHAKRQFLHATMLKIVHPKTKDVLEFRSGYPDDMDDFLRQFLC
jgi:23S rRNA pseudouridine1911/1915/1917 synthase